MNIIALQEIAYPVYRLPDKPNVDDGVMYYYSEVEKEDVVHSKLLIVDDTNLEGDTLAKRRFKVLSDGTPIYRLRNAIFFLGDLIKSATPSTYFIDSKGKLFNYHKTTTAKLNFYKISHLVPIPTGGAIIEVEGLPSRFKVLHTPEDDKICAGVLHIGMSLVLYGLYSDIPENTRRRV